VREGVGRFFDNARVIPRFANNLFQLKLAEAALKSARFGINTTLGLAGFFDPADLWFGLEEHPNDFGLTIRYLQYPDRPLHHVAVLWTFNRWRHGRTGGRRRDESDELLLRHG